MSVTFITALQPVQEPVYHCDGPGCKEKTDDHLIEMPIEVSHGWGSPLDMTAQHFCSIACLKQWALELKDDN